MAKSKTRSGSPVRLVLGLGAFLLALMGVALFVVLGTDPVPVGASEQPGAVDTADVPPTEGAEEPTSGGRRGVRTTGGAAANVAATLRGRLRAYRTREPVVGVALTLTIPPEVEGGEPLLLVSQSDAGGTFRFVELPPRAGCALAGTHAPFAPLALSGIDLAPLETRDLGTIWLDVPVDLPVDVVALDGTPVAAARVDVFATTGGAAEDDAEDEGVAGVAATPAPTASATTDDAGAATVSGLLPGTYHVRATADGHGTAFEDGVLVAPDATRTRVRLLLPRGHALSGTVLDAAEAPVPDARVIAAPQHSTRKPLDKVEAATTVDGSYELQGLAPGIHTLYLARDGHPLVLGGTARVPEMTRLDIRLRPTAALLGTVRDAAGATIVDAHVSYLPQGGVELTTRTGDDGAYRLDDVPSGPSQYFRVRKDGYVPFPDPTAPQQGTGEALREGAEVRRDVVLEAGVAVTVTVLGAGDDHPIEAALVELRMAQVWGGGGKPWTATTGEDGAARFPGIVPGTYLVIIQAAGWVQPDFPANPQVLQQSPQAMPAAWRLDVTAATSATYRLERGSSVSGKVLGKDGEPFAGARITVTGAQSQAPVFSAEDGTFTVDAVPARRRAVATANAPDTPPASSEPFVVRAGEAVQDIEIELTPGARITGRVRSSEGRPLEGAHVRFVKGHLQSGNPWGFQQFDRAPSHPVSADGTFEIRGIEDGAVTVRADADGHLPGWDAQVTVAAGRDVGGIDIILEPATQLAGRVETQAGEPVAGALVYANYSGDGRERRWGFVAALPGAPQAQSDAAGRFVLRGLKPGNYHLWANAPGHAAASVGDVATGSGDVLIRLGRAERIAGIVKGPDGAGLGGIPVQARNADQNRNGNNRWWGGGNQVFTTPDGSFELRDLVEGVYDLSVSASAVWGRDVNVRDTTKQGVRTGQTDVEILVEAGTTIEGQVLDEADAAVTSGWVSAQNETGDRNRGRWGGNQRWTRVAPDGTFRVAGLEPGAHTLQAYGTFLADPMRGVAAGSTDVELRVRGGHAIQGWLVDSEGLSIATGFNVQVRKQGTEAWTWSQVHQPGDGAFIVTGLEDTAYDLKIQASPFAPLELPNVVVGTDDLEVVLRVGQEIEGTVVDARGSPVAANVQASEIDVSAGSTATHGWARAGDDGAFKVVGLVDGRYRLYVRGGNFAPAIVEPVRGGTVGLRIVLEPGVTVGGTVKYEDGTPVPNARLQLQIEGGLAVAWSRSAQDGTFTFEKVPSTGSFELTGNAQVAGRNTAIRHEPKVEPGATDVAVVVR